MNCETSDIIWVGLECSHLFMCVVIEYSKLEIIRTGDEPVFACNKFDTTNWDFSNFECFYYSASLVVIDVDCAIVKTC